MRQEEVEVEEVEEEEEKEEEKKEEEEEKEEEEKEEQRECYSPELYFAISYTRPSLNAAIYAERDLDKRAAGRWDSSLGG
jgi:hypothetical protein